MTPLRFDPVSTHSYGQLGGDMTGASSRVLGVKVGREAAQEARFEDVSTATVGEEATLVQVHLLPGCLEVQSHCTAQSVESVTQQAWSLACQRKKTFEHQWITVGESVEAVTSMCVWCSSILQKWESV